MNANITASSGIAYNLSPITMGDFQSFRLWAQFYEWESFQVLKDRMDPDDFAAESKRLVAMCSARKWSVNTAEVQEMFGTLEGAQYLIYLSLHKLHPDLTYSAVGDLLTMDAVKEATDKINMISGNLFNDKETPKKKVKV